MGVASAAEKRIDDDRHGQKERLGGARADFVANLGRRRAEVSQALDLLRDDRRAVRHRDDLRRRLHALAAGARLLRFTALGDELRRVEERLDGCAARGVIEEADFDAVTDVLGRMTTLAWGQTETRSTSAGAALRADETSAGARAVPISVLIVGPGSLGDALTMTSELERGAPQLFEVERSEETGVAFDLAKALAPDLLVLDGDLAGATILVETLASDPMTELLPVVVVGRFAKAEDGAKFAALGVARTLPKPVSPGELRRACATTISSYVKHEIVREPIGQVNVDQLGARLAEELRRGLTDVENKIRETRVDLGEGTEVFAALWGAVARIRDVVTIHSKGDVRFQQGGPEGAMPLAPWIGSSDPREQNGRAPYPRAVRATAHVSLEKARVVVADDDPAVNWFLAGVLKTAGATVYEARDGERALEIAKHCEPDLVITDILMPKLDGFALARALRRDLVLRDVPIILLSWKEDLLQRVRELGADVDGYMRKEASAGAVVQRVREILRQRRRVQERIAGGGEVRGRLDGLTTATLLRLVAATRPDATVTVRDASFLYELEIREGRPVRATRTSAAGAFERGSVVVAAFLGVGDGRFVVAPSREDQDVARVRADLAGTMSDQLIPAIAKARAAQRLLSGANLVRIQRIGVDEECLQAYLVATPEPARGLLRSVAAGASPRAIFVGGDVAPRLLEDVLADAAAHGAITEVIDAAGTDRMPEITAEESSILRGERAARPILTIPLLQVPALAEPSPAAPLAIAMPAPSDVMKAALQPQAPVQGLVGFPASTVDDLILRGDDAEVEVSTEGLDDAWFAGVAATEEESPVAPSGPRALTPAPMMASPNVRTPSPRPVVIKPEPTELTPTPSHLPPPPGLRPMLSLGSLHPPPVTEPEPEPKPKKLKTPRPEEARSKKEAARDRSETPSAPFVDKNAVMLPSAYLPRMAPVPKKDHKALYWVLFALCGVGFAVWARWSRDRTAVSEDVLQPVAAAEATTEVTAAPEASGNSDAAAPAKAATKDDGDDAPEVLALRDIDKVKKGQGMLEIIAGKSDTVYIDGRAMGSGPVVDAALKAKSDPYEVKVKLRGEERVRFVTIKEGHLTRVRVAPPWAR